MRVSCFQSILFDGAVSVEDVGEPAFFADLNLDQVVDAVTVGRDEYGLRPFFSLPLHAEDAVRFRHEVFRDLDRSPVREAVAEFAQRMHAMRARRRLAEKLYYTLQRQRWLLDAADLYCGAVTSLHTQLDRVELASRGLRGLREHLADYLGSATFRTLVADTVQVREELAQIKYCVHIRGDRVRVARYAGEADYSTVVEKTFAKFKQAAVKDHRVEFRDTVSMDHVQAQVLNV